MIVLLEWCVCIVETEEIVGVYPKYRHACNMVLQCEHHTFLQKSEVDKGYVEEK